MTNSGVSDADAMMISGLVVLVKTVAESIRSLDVTGQADVRRAVQEG